jgi:catechol 2,3-dioxygenase-like lactoylglutathione lyase family enzyme
MLNGAHAVIYSRDAERDRAFLRDVLGLKGVDAGGGWLIFGLPPAEVAVHPGEANDEHELFLMCDDVEAFVSEMRARGVECAPIQTPGWGVLTQIRLPGGGKLGVYQPRHARPEPMRAGKRPTRRTAAKRPARKKARAAASSRRKSGARPAKRKARRPR